MGKAIEKLSIEEQEARQRLPGYSDAIGRPMKFPALVVEQALWEMAANGNSATRASRALEEAGIVNPSTGGAISPRTIRDWARKIFRNRYHEIVVEGVRELEEIVASKNIDLAIRQGEAEQSALAQTLAGLPHATAVEASQVLRNINQAKTANVDKALQIRGRGHAPSVEQGLKEVVQVLKSLKLVEQDEVVDADVVEEPAA